jgi:hypothetical protein
VLAAQHLAIEPELYRYDIQPPVPVEQVVVDGKRFESAVHAAKLPAGDSLLRRFEVTIGSRFHFDRDQVTFMLDDQVDFARLGSVIARQDDRSGLDQVRFGELLPPST